MTRFLVSCLLLAAGCIAAVFFLGHAYWTPTPTIAREGAGGGSEESRLAGKPPGGSSSQAVNDDKLLSYRELKAGLGGPAALIVPGGSVLSMERQEVPSEREGKLLFLATEVRPGEVVPRQKLVEYEMRVLAVEVPTWDGVAEKDRFADPRHPDSRYRRARAADELLPNRTMIFRQKLRLRKLDVGDRVKEGQLLGIINPAVAFEDMASKEAKLDASEADAFAAVAMKIEAKRKFEMLRSLARGNAASKDEIGAAKALADRYEQEEISKRQAVRQAQSELSGSLTTLQMHLIRASIDGVIKNVYKQNGEAVKNLEPVLQIQNPMLLRVEAKLEEQDALPLRDRLEKSRKLREEAGRLRALAQGRGQAVPDAVRQMDQEADRLVQVQIETSRVAPPAAALAGHLQAVTCVAVTRDDQPRIVSGSEDQTVRVWGRRPGSDRWQEFGQVDHHAVVRALACTSARAKRSLLLTGTATGRGRLFDLDNLADQTKQRFLQGRHAGSINAVAFSPDGALCVTGGEDRTIYLWETAEGKLLGKATGAHGAAVTSLAFTTKKQVVSAGRDKRLVVWNLGETGQTLEKAEVFDRRSGDVAQLGVDPSGEHTLFDDARELRVLSLSTKKIDGTIQNASTTGGFTTLALYSPDGNTILTNGNGGRLQLWRAPTAKTRPAELRQYAWSSGGITSAAFSPDGKWAVTGTQDNRVLVWQTPEKAEAERPLAGQLTYAEEFLDNSLKRVAVRATFDNPGWIIPGSNAAIVVPHLAGAKK